MKMLKATIDDNEVSFSAGAVMGPEIIFTKDNRAMTLLIDEEKALYRKVQTANFPPATAAKRFMQGDADQIRWSDKGRAFMAYIAHRFRKQYHLTEAEWAWIEQWKRKEEA